MKELTEKQKQCLLDENKTLMMTVGDVHRLFGHNIYDMITRKGVSNTVSAILFHLSYHNELTQVELVELTHLRASTISVAIQKMESDGLIVRNTKEDDLRCMKVSITDEGRKLREQIKEYIHSLDLSLTEGISNEEIEITKKVLRQIIGKMMEEDKK